MLTSRRHSSPYSCVCVWAVAFYPQMGLCLFGSEAAATKVGMGLAVAGNLLDDEDIAHVAEKGGLNNSIRGGSMLQKGLQKGLARLSTCGTAAKMSSRAATTVMADPAQLSVTVGDPISGAPAKSSRGSIFGAAPKPRQESKNREDPQVPAKPIPRGNREREGADAMAQPLLSPAELEADSPNDPEQAAATAAEARKQAIERTKARRGSGVFSCTARRGSVMRSAAGAGAGVGIGGSGDQVSPGLQRAATHPDVLRSPIESPEVGAGGDGHWRQQSSAPRRTSISAISGKARRMSRKAESAAVGVDGREGDGAPETGPQSVDEFGDLLKQSFRLDLDDVNGEVVLLRWGPPEGGGAGAAGGGGGGRASSKGLEGEDGAGRNVAQAA